MGERPYVIDQMISAKAIAARVEELAADITEYFKGTDKLVVVACCAGLLSLSPTLCANWACQLRWIFWKPRPTGIPCDQAARCAF